jgi:hypothetical protein
MAEGDLVRCARQDHVAGLERQAIGRMVNQRLNRMHHA